MKKKKNYYVELQGNYRKIFYSKLLIIIVYIIQKEIFQTHLYNNYFKWLIV